MKKKSLLFILSVFILEYSYGQGGTWTWISGSNVAGATAVYGTQGVPSVNNHPPGMYEPAEWKDNQGNFWVYGGIPTYSDLWRFNPSTLEWTWMKGNGTTNLAPVYGTKGVAAATNTPGRRDYATVTWTDTSGNLWLFGGTTNYRNDLWKYDIAINQWTWVSGSNTANALGVHGTKGVPSTLNVPGGRNETAVSWIDSLNNLWLFGGTGYVDAGGAGNLNDLFRYNIATKEWTWMKGASTINAAPVYGTKYISAANNDPGSRFVYSKWKDLQGNLWLMGGFKNNTEMNDLWRYSPSTNEYTWMSGQNTVDDPGRYQATCVFDTINVPHARVESRAAVTDNCGRFWLFGGAISVLSNITFNYYNDLWIFNPQSNTWSWLSGTSVVNQANTYGTIGVPSPSNKPSSRWGSVSWWGNDNKFYMFGGSANNTSTCYGDVWVFNPDPNCVSNCSTTALPVASFISSDSAFCAEGQNCIDFTDFSTGNATDWKWYFPGAVPNNSNQQNPTNICYYTPGTYTVSLVASNAAGSDSLAVPAMIKVGDTPPQPVLTFSGDTVTCSHASAYQWYFNGSPIFGATDSFYVATVPGVLSVQITDDLGCVRLSSGIYVSVDEVIGVISVKIYPNPPTSSFVIQLNVKLHDAEVIIYDILGKEMMRRKMSGDKMEIERGSMESGVYFVKVRDEEKEVVQKLIVE